jgi:hypothetical protein
MASRGNVWHYPLIRAALSAAGYREQVSRSALCLSAKTATDTGIIDLGSDGLAL